MTKFKASNFVESFGYAWRGLKLAFNSQRNFVFEVIIAFFVILASVLLRFDFSDIAILVIMCAIVLICEMFNSVIEFSLDAVFKNEYSKLVEMAKDMAGWVNKKMLFEKIHFWDFEPRKGFKCKEYFNI